MDRVGPGPDDYGRPRSCERDAGRSRRGRGAEATEQRSGGRARVRGRGHGWAVVTGASGGYLIAFPLAAALTGRLAERRLDRRFPSAIGVMPTGNVLVYLIGRPWLAVELGTGLEETLELGLYPFVPGDTLKLYVAAAPLPGAWGLVGRN